MEKLFGNLMRSLKLLKRRKILRRLVAILECIVVVATTWSLVLPAITLSGEAAAQQDGIVLEGSIDPDYAAAAPGSADNTIPEEAVNSVLGGTEDPVAGETNNPMSGETGDSLSGEAGSSASSEGGEDASATLTGTVVPESLDLHSEKQVDSDVAGSIPQGTVVTVLEDQGDGWLFIVSSGRYLWRRRVITTHPANISATG